MQHADIYVPASTGKHASFRGTQLPHAAPLEADMLRPALCLSRSGRATAKSFTVRGAPAKVHTNLLQLLIAHQVTESMVEQLLGVTDATGVTTIQDAVRLHSGSAEASARGAYSSAHLLRDKHLSPYLQRKYQVGGAPPLHRPRLVEARQPVHRVAAARRNTFQQEYKDAAAELCDLNAGQRALVGEALQFAQEALTRDRLAAKQVYRKASEDSAAARSRTAKKGTPSRGGSSAFLSTDRPQSARVGYVVMRTGMGTTPTKGPAHYNPAWQQQRPAACSVRLVPRTTTARQPCARPAHVRPRGRSHAAPRRPYFAPAQVEFSPASRNGDASPRSSPKRPAGCPAAFPFAHAANSAAFKASDRTSLAGYTLLVRPPSGTSPSVGPGTYDEAALRCVRPRSATPAGSFHLTARSRPESAPVSNVGPGSYYPRSDHRSSDTMVDFRLRSARPGVAPAVIAPRKCPATAQPASSASEADVACTSLRSAPPGAGGAVLRAPSLLQRPVSCAARTSAGECGKCGECGESADAGWDDDQAFIYEDDAEEGCEDGTCALDDMTSAADAAALLSHRRSGAATLPHSDAPQRSARPLSGRPPPSARSLAARPATAAAARSRATDAIARPASAHPLLRVAEEVPLSHMAADALCTAAAAASQLRPGSGALFSNPAMRDVNADLLLEERFGRPGLALRTSQRPASAPTAAGQARPHSARDPKPASPGPGHYLGLNAPCAVLAGRVTTPPGGTFARCTRTQELRGQRLMGDGRTVKPVTAPACEAGELAYDANFRACAHRRRVPGITMPPNRVVGLRNKRWLSAASLGAMAAR